MAHCLVNLVNSCFIHQCTFFTWLSQRPGDIYEDTACVLYTVSPRVARRGGGYTKDVQHMPREFPVIRANAPPCGFPPMATLVNE